MTEAAFWRRCSICKKEMPFSAVYWVCNVSACNRPRTALAFCSVPCFDAHVPTLRHRDAWAEEQRAPRKEEWERRQREEASPAPAAPRPRPMSVPRAPRGEILVIASRLKDYVRSKSAMNTSDAVLDVLSDKLRALCDDAIKRAREAGRSTVLERDF
jgi:hypothetical protein